MGGITTEHFSLAYGDGFQDIAIDGATSVKVLEGGDAPLLPDFRAAFLHGLDHPIGTAPLRELISSGDKVTILVSDITRGWMRQDRIAPLLVDYLHTQGITYENIVFLIANGTHRPHSDEEKIRIVSEELSLCHRPRL